eukprot:10242-Heterococcus_DN1.PRE.1
MHTAQTTASIAVVVAIKCSCSSSNSECIVAASVDAVSAYKLMLQGLPAQTARRCVAYSSADVT